MRRPLLLCLLLQLSYSAAQQKPLSASIDHSPDDLTSCTEDKENAVICMEAPSCHGGSNSFDDGSLKLLWIPKASAGCDTLARRRLISPKAFPKEYIIEVKFPTGTKKVHYVLDKSKMKVQMQTTGKNRVNCPRKTYEGNDLSCTFIREEKRIEHANFTYLILRFNLTKEPTNLASTTAKPATIAPAITAAPTPTVATSTTARVETQATTDGAAPEPTTQPAEDEPTSEPAAQEPTTQPAEDEPTTEPAAQEPTTQPREPEPAVPSHHDVHNVVPEEGNHHDNHENSHPHNHHAKSKENSLLALILGIALGVFIIGCCILFCVFYQKARKLDKDASSSKTGSVPQVHSSPSRRDGRDYKDDSSTMEAVRAAMSARRKKKKSRNYSKYDI